MPPYLVRLLVVGFLPLSAASAQEKHLAVNPAHSIDSKTTVVFQSREGTYWFGGGPSGVFRYDGSSLLRFTKDDGLCGHSLLAIHEDDKGSLYFDTAEGVCVFDGQRFKTLDRIIKHETAESGWRLSDLDLWFRGGWSKRGPLRYDGQELHQLAFPDIPQAAEFRRKFPNAAWSPYDIYTQYRDSNGNMWFGTSALGACRYDGHAFRWLDEQHLSHTPAGRDFGLRSIVEDREGLFWFCNTRYRYRIKPEQSSVGQKMSYNRLPGVSAVGTDNAVRIPYFLSAALDDAGDLWLVTYDEGVWKCQGNQLLHYPVSKSGERALLFSIVNDNSGTLWLGSHDAGVFRFNGDSFQNFTFAAE